MRTFEQCEKCGRFMKHVWYLASESYEDWQDYWDCSLKCNWSKGTNE